MPVKLKWIRIGTIIDAILPLPKGQAEVTVFKYGRPGEPLIVVVPPLVGWLIYDAYITIARAFEEDNREVWLLEVHIKKPFEDYLGYFVGDKFEDVVAAALKLATAIAEHSAKDEIIEEDYLMIAQSHNLKPLKPNEVKKLKMAPFSPVEAGKAVHVIEKAIRDLNPQL